MRSENTYTPGTYVRTCDRCGFDYLRKDMKKEWTGLVVCKSCFDPKHDREERRPRIKERPFKGD